MIKTLLSPLCIALLILWPLQVWRLVKEWNESLSTRIVVVVTLVVLLVISLPSLISVNKWLYHHLEQKEAYDYVCPMDVVVVLSGGYYIGAEPSQDQLDSETVLRVQKGVQVFQRCKPRFFVVSGTLVSTPKARMVELMRDMAVRMGVPAELILIEDNATNTREHPVRLSEMKLVKEDAHMAVVTSPWHVRRAMGEFRRIFPHSVPVASHYFSSTHSHTWDAWLPHVGVLENSTMLIYEYIGMLWYDILHRYYLWRTGYEMHNG